MMSITVAEAKKQLRQARLNEHLGAIAKALAEKNLENLASASSRFLALYRNKGKSGKK